MAKLLTIAPSEKAPPLCHFFGELDEKQRRKLFAQFRMLRDTPLSALREPHVKHFSLERYRAFYELRAKSRNLIRIVFYPTEEGDILLLMPFIKHQPRDTMQALDASLSLLARVKDGSCPVKELTINFFDTGGKML